MLIIEKDIQLHDIEAIVRIVQALEKRFPDHNSGFAYGTRLCEETGELVEAIADYDSSNSDEGRLHLAKELQDLLRVVIGIMQVYGTADGLPENLKSMQSNAVSDISGTIVNLVVATGQLANAINHTEGSGIKRQTLGNEATSRIIEKAHGVLSIVMSIVNQYGISSDMDEQIIVAYRRYKHLGYIV